jgi:hypothetical protein
MSDNRGRRQKMSWGIYYHSDQQQKSNTTTGPRNNLLANPLRVTAILIFLATIWIVVGSAIYPLWWFEFFLKSGFCNLESLTSADTWGIDGQNWLLIPLLILVCSSMLVMWKFRTTVFRFVDRFGIYVVIGCIVAGGVDIYYLDKTQRFKYEMLRGVANIGDAMAKLFIGLVESALPPSEIIPPVDFLYADKDRIAMLYSEIQPALRLDKHTVARDEKNDNSLDLERKPLTLKLDGSHGKTETDEFKYVDPTTARQAFELVNGLLARAMPPYYGKYEQLRGFQFLKQAKDFMKSASEGLSKRSLFVAKPPDGGTLATLKQMAELEKNTPSSVIESRIRAQLSQLSGLVIVQGEFQRISLRQDSGEFVEQFKGEPRPIYFRLVVTDKEALRLLPEHTRLLVLGDVINRWDGNRYIEVHPMAISNF